jgi:hypothetical protein
MFWLTLGATAGVLVVRKVTRTAQTFTPAGLANRAAGLGDTLRDFADQVRAAMAEREIELRDALGIDNDRHDLPPAEAADVIERPMSIRPTAD